MQQLADMKKTLEQFKVELFPRYHFEKSGLVASVVRNDFFPTGHIDIIVEFNPVGVKFINLPDYMKTNFVKRQRWFKKNGIQEKY